MNTFTFEPVGFVRCAERYTYEAPRQSCRADNAGIIEFAEHRNFEQALADLKGIERIWILFVFDRTRGRWRSVVSPPVVPARRIGVFATRSPHRPNPIGLSCVELTGVEKNLLHIRNFDLLDGTPVLDVKPYLPDADAFPDARTGWRENVQRHEYTVRWLPEALAVARVIQEASGLSLENFARVQLGDDPLNRARKRFDGENLCCRTWRISFSCDEAHKEIVVNRIASGYSSEELRPGAPDPYGDKELHRKIFGI